MLRRLAWGLIAGVVWGVIAWGLGGSAFRRAIWGGVIASPLIGAFVAMSYRWMPDVSRPWRVLGALASVYTAAVLFALAMAAWHAISRMAPPASFETLTQYVVAVLWGVTFTGYLLVFWPLAYATHAWLARAAGE